MKNYKKEKLENGESFITSEKGNSMVGQNKCLEKSLKFCKFVYVKIKNNPTNKR